MKHPKWDKIFTKRFEAHQQELKWLYYELYHNNEEAYNYFVDMLYDYYQKRSMALKEWDDARLNVKDWYKGNEMCGMLLYTQCFNQDLQGIIDKLDYFKETNINYIHLMPLLESPIGKNDGGYAVSDFTTVQPELGTMADLAKLADHCHQNGISLCLDFVMNHTSEDHQWAKDARNFDPIAMSRYFIYDDWGIPNEFEKTVPQVFPQSAPGNFTWNEQLQKVVMTTFYPYQWDLNYANPIVFNDMTGFMLNLCNHGVDILRLDAVPYIWKQLYTTCRNLPQVHTLVRMMRMAVEVVCPGTLLLGEVVMEPKEVVPYFGTIEKPECHMLYNVTTMASTWHTVATGDVRLLAHQLQTVFNLPKDYTFLNYLRCHDDIGWGLDYNFLAQFGINEVAHKKFLNDFFTGQYPNSYAKGELYNDDPRLGDARLTGMSASLCGIESALEQRDETKLNATLRLDVMLHAFLLTQSGIPVLYSGDEIGQLNDYSYHQDPNKSADSRYLHRGQFDWDKAAKRHDLSTYEGQLYSKIKQLTTLRQQYEVFEGEADVWLFETRNSHILGIGRYYNGQKLIALFNFSSEEEIAWIKEEEAYRDLITNQPREAKLVTLAPYDFVWLYYNYDQARVRSLHVPKHAKTRG